MASRLVSILKYLGISQKMRLQTNKKKVSTFPPVKKINDNLLFSN